MFFLFLSLFSLFFFATVVRFSGTNGNAFTWAGGIILNDPEQEILLLFVMCTMRNGLGVTKVQKLYPEQEILLLFVLRACIMRNRWGFTRYKSSILNRRFCHFVSFAL